VEAIPASSLQSLQKIVTASPLLLPLGMMSIKESGINRTQSEKCIPRPIRREDHYSLKSRVVAVRGRWEIQG